MLDFGISKVQSSPQDASLTDSGAVLGTMHYLSPEQVMNADVDSYTDQYALGVVLYECLTGHRPHEGETLFEVMKNISEARSTRPSQLRPDLPPGFEAIVLRAMALEPTTRFPSVHALGAALLPFASMKRRVIWTDYFGRDPLEASLPLGGATKVGDPAVAHPAVPKAMMISAPAPQRTQLLASDWWPAPTAPLPAEKRPQADTLEHPGDPYDLRAAINPTPTRSARRLGWILGAVGVVGLAAAALLLVARNDLRGLKPESPRSLAVSQSPVAAPIGLFPPATMTEPAAPPADEVTIGLTGAPAGLIAMADGKAVSLPLKLSRGAPPREITFAAPGYRPRAIVVDGKESVIAVHLEPQRRDTKRSRSGSNTSSTPKNPNRHETNRFPSTAAAPGIPANRNGSGSSVPPPFTDL